MRDRTPLHPGAPARPCVVCGEALDWRTPLTARPGGAAELHAVCAAHACRQVFALVPGRSAPEFLANLRWRAGLFRQERRRIGAQKARLDRQREEDEAAFAGRWAARAELKLVVPSGRAGSRALTARRRRAYAAHLDAIIAEALASDETVPDTGPSPAADARMESPSRLPSRLCAACGGGCCVAGGDHAFLTAETIRGVLATSPERDAAGLRAAYLAAAPGRSVEGSCIHHTPRGCSLPRAMRSRTCEAYACDALKTLRRALDGEAPVRRVAVLQRRQSQWSKTDLARDNAIVAAAILTEGELRRRPAPDDADR